MKKALILLSGGLDSTTVTAIAKKQNYQIYALSFDYGQRHKIELESVKKVIDFFEIKNNLTIKINSNIFLNSSLTSDLKVPEHREIDDEIPNSYVPARNILFLSYALAFAESYNITNIFIGVNSLDYSGYPDCRPNFIKAFQDMANLGTKLGQSKKILIQTPLLNLTKKEIIRKGLGLGVNYKITHSCYNPKKNGYPCKICDSCQLRIKAFLENNIIDPLL